MRLSNPTPWGLVLGLLGLLVVMGACRAGSRPLAPPVHDDAPRARPDPGALEPPSPLSLTASDGTGLSLATVDARAVIEDPLALTELTLAFDNPQMHVVEGRFEIVLPAAAQVTRFAMEIDGRWQEAEVVEKQHARQVYEAHLHAARDPALLERDTGNRFRARVFPIRAGERKRVLVSYVEPLPDLQTPYRLALRGMPWLERLEARVMVAEPGHPAGYRTERFELRSEAPARDLIVARPASSAVGLRRGERVVARVEPLAGVDAAQIQRFERLTVLVDTSASRALDHDRAIDRLGQLLRALSRRVGTAQVELVAFDQEVVPIHKGPLGSVGPSVLAALRRRRPLGASDLEAALVALAEGPPRPTRDRVLLVTDGLVSAGSASNARLRQLLAALARRGAQRIDVLRVGEIYDPARLQQLVTGPLPQSGVILEPEQSPERAADRMVLTTMDEVYLEVPGASFWAPKRVKGLQPGDHVLVHAELPSDRSMVVQVAGAVHLEHAVALREVDSPLVDHAVIHGRVQSLVERLAALHDTLEAEQLRRVAVSLSVRHRIFNELTAFIVLETEEDYARFGLDRRSLSDVLVVGPQGVERRDRTVAAAAEPSPAEPPPDPVDPAAADQGSISGVVTDARSSATRIAGALVVLQCACLPGTRETVTNARGLYAFRGLPPGTYTIQVLHRKADVSKITTLPDGAKFRANFRINPDQEFSKMIRVQSQAVEARGRRRRGRWRARHHKEAPAGTSPPTDDQPALPLDPQSYQPPPPEEPDSDEIVQMSTTVRRTVTMEEFREIPVRSSSGRDFTQVIDAAPTSARDSAGITLAGTTGAESKYTVQGANVSLGGVASYGDNFGPRSPRVLMQQVRVEGRGLARSKAVATLHSWRSSLTTCYERALWRDDRVRGRVRIELRLDAEGDVRAVNRRWQLGIHDSRLRRCVADALSELRFPTRAGKRPRVSVSLIFWPGDGSSAPVDAVDDLDPPAPPSDPPASLAAVQQHLDQRQHRKAWAMATRWRESSPSDLLALLALGRVARATGQLQRAARAYGSILDLHPSRAEMRRFAAGQLEALGEPGLALAVDAYRKAQAERPDHPSSYRSLAFALVRQGDPREAFEVLAAGLEQHYPAGRFSGVERVLREDLGVVAAAWRHRHPTDAARIDRRLLELGATLAQGPSLRAVLTWETDANDVDLHVIDREGHDTYHEQPRSPAGGELIADVNTGFGPECFVAYGEAARAEYQLRVHYFDRGPMGYGMGKVQIVRHDGRGEIRVEDRPFVIVEDNGWVELGTLTAQPEPSEADAARTDATQTDGGRGTAMWRASR